MRLLLLAFALGTQYLSFQFLEVEYHCTSTSVGFDENYFIYTTNYINRYSNKLSVVSRTRFPGKFLDHAAVLSEFIDFNLLKRKVAILVESSALEGNVAIPGNLGSNNFLILIDRYDSSVTIHIHESLKDREVELKKDIKAGVLLLFGYEDQELKLSMVWLSGNLSYSIFVLILYKEKILADKRFRMETEVVCESNMHKLYKAHKPLFWRLYTIAKETIKDQKVLDNISSELSLGLFLSGLTDIKKYSKYLDNLSGSTSRKKRTEPISKDKLTVCMVQLAEQAQTQRGTDAEYISDIKKMFQCIRNPGSIPYDLPV
eukprot:NODE_919_length_3094_cov_0.575292.p2 type:complete len:316 gc:universal NODE_919_length_3094_cov_0.575292:203-1150(+)